MNFVSIKLLKAAENALYRRVLLTDLTFLKKLRILIFNEININFINAEFYIDSSLF